MSESKHKYVLTSNWNTEECSDPLRFSNEKEAWNYLSKRLDARYKTGGGVIVKLYRVDTIKFLHPRHGKPNKIYRNQKTTPDNEWRCRIPVVSGYAAYDYDGNPWNNPTSCLLCGQAISPKLYRDSGYCKTCSPVIDSLIAWDTQKIRKPAKITQEILDILKLKSNRWSDADFLIRDGTLKLVG